eukprot:1988730-Pleurochrysis_carterae.AAC.3
MSKTGRAKVFAQVQLCPGSQARRLAATPFLAPEERRAHTPAGFSRMIDATSATFTRRSTEAGGNERPWKGIVEQKYSDGYELSHPGRDGIDRRQGRTQQGARDAERHEESASCRFRRIRISRNGELASLIRRNWWRDAMDA